MPRLINILQAANHPTVYALFRLEYCREASDPRAQCVLWFGSARHRISWVELGERWGQAAGDANADANNGYGDDHGRAWIARTAIELGLRAGVDGAGRPRLTRNASLIPITTAPHIASDTA
jgi:hypothetical protein